MTKHIIIKIDFKKDYLQRSCGWEGRAYDLTDYIKHTKECAQLNEEGLIEFIPQYEGKFMKRRTLQEVY